MGLSWFQVKRLRRTIPEALCERPGQLVRLKPANVLSRTTPTIRNLPHGPSPRTADPLLRDAVFKVSVYLLAAANNTVD